MSVNYDFIIIGGGSSGSALASVLATKGSTLLIERGANHTNYPQSSVRQGWPQISAITLSSLRYEGSGHWTGTPSILGGGSASNAGGCFRGERSFFQSLNFDLVDVDKAFQHLEDRLCKPAMDSQIVQVFGDSYAESGMLKLASIELSGYAGWIGGVEGTFQRGRTVLSTNSNMNGSASNIIEQEHRRPASDLFENSISTISSSVADHENLTVFLLTTVKRVIFDNGSNKKAAIGVDISSPAGEFSVYVRGGGKIFLNAGAYETPKILMLSGIGPAQTLSKYNIPTVIHNDLVGQSLIERKEFIAGIPSFKNLEGDDSILLDFAAFKEKYWSSSIHKYSTEWGNAIQGCKYCLPGNRSTSCRDALLGGLLLSGSNRQMEPPYLLPLLVAQRFPTTRGNVTLSSSNFMDAPIVHDGWSQRYEYLSPDALYDLETIVDGVQDLIVDLLRNTQVLKNLGHVRMNQTGNFAPEVIDVLARSSLGLSHLDDDIDECTFSPSVAGKDISKICSSWDQCVPTVPQLSNDRDKMMATVFEFLASSHHISGTCKAGGVVDKGTLAVKGVNGLYISDLSIAPEPIGIHPMMTAMSLGIVLGNIIDGPPTGRYELFPVLLSLGCIAIVMLLIGFIVLDWSSKSELDTMRSKNRQRNTLTIDESVAIKSSVTFENEITYHTEMGALDSSKFVVTSTTCNKEYNNDLVERNVIDPTVGSLTKSPIMAWSGVSCIYEGKGKKSTSITTLFKNFGFMKAGEITAIMGPSGAAKSTLLDILAGRKSVGRIHGNFSVLGKNFNASTNGMDSLCNAIKGNSAYIPQDEYFYPTQTTVEAVSFAANMKFGGSDTMHRKLFVHSCLDKVGLPVTVYASRRIGGDLTGGFSIRGLSGGERKRLALACVLALKPKMMFIDELTSGLDSENTLLVMELLKDLSVTQRVATMIIIHQPNPQVFALFDQLILLSRGKCMFSGPCAQLSTFYDANYKETMPANVNLADDLITKATAFDSSATFSYVGESPGSDPATLKTTTSLNPDIYSPVVSSTLWKLFTVFNRNLTTQYIRNITNVAARLTSYCLLSAMIGAIFWQVGEPSSPRGLTYEEASLVARTNTFLLNVSYLLPFATIPVFVCDKRFFAAESAIGLYSPWMYGVSQLFLEFAFVTFASILEAAIAIPMCSMWNPSLPPAMSFLTTLSALIASGLVGSTLVLLCSIWLPTQDMAFLAASTIATLSLALSGGFLPFSEMPPLASSLQWISPVKYSFQALLIGQLEGTSAERLVYLYEYDTPSSVSANIGVLFAFFVVFSFFTGIGIVRVREIR